VEENNFESTDILTTEEAVLNALDFDIYLPTVIDYLHIYLHCIPELASDPILASFARYLAEMSLLHWNFLFFPPSKIALSVCVYSLLSFNKHHWPNSLAAISFFPYSELIDCIRQLRDALVAMSTLSQATVYRRYLKQDHHKVASKIPQLIIPNTVDIMF
jgi:cyclin A